MGTALAVARLLTPGTVAGAMFLGAASFAFKLYVTHFGSYDKTYGSLGAVIRAAHVALRDGPRPARRA